MARRLNSLIAAMVGLAIGAATIGSSYAHDAPSGWTYPLACCSDYDCREVGDAYTPDAKIRVFETAEGYRISSTDETIPYGSRKIRSSPDGMFHWCSVRGKDDSGTICLFVPPRAY